MPYITIMSHRNKTLEVPNRDDLFLAQAENDRYLDLLRRWLEAESYWEFGETVEPVHAETVQALKAAGWSGKIMPHRNKPPFDEEEERAAAIRHNRGERPETCARCGKEIEDGKVFYWEHVPFCDECEVMI